MKRIIAAAVAATSFFPMTIEADEAALDGLLWSYDIFEGGAVIRSVQPVEEESDGDAGEAGAETLEPSAPSLTALKIPSELGQAPVLAIGDGAFEEMDGLREVKIPAGVMSIGARAFKDCRALRSVKLPPSVIEIKNRAFSGCRSLKSINLGANITNIEDRVFRDCRALSSIDLPDDLADIGEKAFADCSSLHSVTIPRGVTNIASWAFADCTSLAVAVFLGPEPRVGEEVFARVDAQCFFRASGAEGWSVEIPGVWQGRRIVDLAIETYRRRILIFLPMIVGAIGTVAILVLAIVLRERRNDDDDGM